MLVLPSSIFANQVRLMMWQLAKWLSAKYLNWKLHSFTLFCYH